jgi:adenylate cyclase
LFGHRLRRIGNRPALRWLARLGRRIGVRRSIGLPLLAALIALRVWDPGPLENLRLRSFDFYQSLKPRADSSRPVVIVDIDDSSLKTIGQWPWPRTIVADLVNKLHDLGALVVAFDIIFSEPDRMSPPIAADSFRNLDADTLAKLRNMPSNDTLLADAISRSNVVLGQSGASGRAAAKDDTAPLTGFAIKGPSPDPYLVNFGGLLRNLPLLEQAAAGRGLLTIKAERDGIVRRLPMIMKAGETMAPALTLEMLRVVTKSGAILVKTDPAGVQSVAVPGLELPTDRNGQLWINFSEHDPNRYVSAKDVLDGRVGADRFEGKLALIGTSAVGLLDIKTTPLDAAIPGVEIQAQVLENALSGLLLSYPNYAIAFELLSALVFGLIIVIFAPMIGALPLLALGIAVGAALTAISWYAYATKGVLLDLTFPLLSSFALYAVLVFTGYFREQRDRRQIRSAFSQYLSPALVEQLAQSPKRLKLGGEERTMTIMFSDVRGFTTISESFKNDPQGLTHLMNRFLTPLTNAIINDKGTIDKYMGDAIMAFWNAPIDDPRHEINSCHAALEMLRCVDELNQERQLEAQEDGVAFIPIHIGVGINTGQCVVGNMGSDLRFDYSVLGDPVNLASRLEGRSKSYGTPIIVGSRTAERAKDEFAALEIDLITVKGKTEPERIYTVLGGGDVLTNSAFAKLRDLNGAMLASYRARRWDDAMDALRACRGLQDGFQLDEIYRLYLARIQSFRDNPPPDDWNGVFAVDTK